MSAPSVALSRIVCRFLHGTDAEWQSLSSEPSSDTYQMSKKYNKYSYHDKKHSNRMRTARFGGHHWMSVLEGGVPGQVLGTGVSGELVYHGGLADVLEGQVYQKSLVQQGAGILIEVDVPGGRYTRDGVYQVMYQVGACHGQVY